MNTGDEEGQGMDQKMPVTRKGKRDWRKVTGGPSDDGGGRDGDSIKSYSIQNQNFTMVSSALYINFLKKLNKKSTPLLKRGT